MALLRALIFILPSDPSGSTQFAGMTNIFDPSPERPRELVLNLTPIRFRGNDGLRGSISGMAMGAGP
jgi:hypothetical protein